MWLCSGEILCMDTWIPENFQELGSIFLDVFNLLKMVVNNTEASGGSAGCSLLNLLWEVSSAIPTILTSPWNVLEVNMLVILRIRKPWFDYSLKISDVKIFSCIRVVQTKILGTHMYVS